MIATLPATDAGHPRSRYGRAVLVCLLAALVPAGAAAQSLPASGDEALGRLDASPRHGEWVTYDAGGGDRVTAWVVHPERSDPAPVVVVIHEIYGLTDWIRAVADQLAAEGFLAIAPDLLSGKGPGGGGTDSVDQQGAVRLIRTLDTAEGPRRYEVTGPFESDDGDVLTGWALAGRGIVLKPYFEVADHLRSGALVPVAEATPPLPVQLAALTPHRRLRDPKTRLFTDFMVARCKAELAAALDGLDLAR